jgi:hypothetical protein
VNHDCASVVRDALVERENALALAARVRELEAELDRLRANPNGPSLVRADRVFGCARCGKPAALVDDKAPAHGVIECFWCSVDARPGAFAAYRKDAAQSPPAAEPQKTGG